ncbi:MAG: class I SAM-dependent DNA methyltransferase, partial [Paracoccaceae bacterium]
NTALDAGQVPQAANLARVALSSLRLNPMTAASLILVLRAASDPDADGYADKLLSLLSSGASDPSRRMNLGRLTLALDRKAEGAAILAAALQELPTHKAGVMALTNELLQQGDIAATTALWQPLFTDDPTNGLLRLELVRILALSGFLGEARRWLDVAEPLCVNNRGEFDIAVAALRGTAVGTSQAAMTIEMFERFAPTYDEKLEKLGNRGPDTIARMLTDLNLPQKRQLAVLDAGCGTGLCGPFLRPYAKRLVGVDLSPAMLAKARARKLFHKLERCDLGSIGTYPSGPFDLLISADVLVYFGDLAQVFANFGTVMRPGGWLLFTVEGTDKGWHLAPSGRHKHSLPYLEEVLRKAGFGKPRLVEHSDLRHEFGKPVPGIGVAVQKLALFA